MMMPPPIPIKPAMKPAAPPTMTKSKRTCGAKRLIDDHEKKPARKKGWLVEKLEAPTRFELVMEVLQTSALPLGDGAKPAIYGRLSSVLITDRYRECQGKIPIETRKG